MLAPLLDQMTTRDIGRRFTAQQAIKFLEEFSCGMSHEDLEQSPPPRTDLCNWMSYEEYDRWRYLPEDFLRNWGHLREPKPSSTIKLLRYICEFHWGRVVVQLIRSAINFGKATFAHWSWLAESMSTIFGIHRRVMMVVSWFNWNFNMVNACNTLIWIVDLVWRLSWDGHDGPTVYKRWKDWNLKTPRFALQWIIPNATSIPAYFANRYSHKDDLLSLIWA